MYPHCLREQKPHQGYINGTISTDQGYYERPFCYPTTGNSSQTIYHSYHPGRGSGAHPDHTGTDCMSQQPPVVGLREGADCVPSTASVPFWHGRSYHPTPPAAAAGSSSSTSSPYYDPNRALVISSPPPPQQLQWSSDVLYSCPGGNGGHHNARGAIATTGHSPELPISSYSYRSAISLNEGLVGRGGGTANLSPQHGYISSSAKPSNGDSRQTGTCYHTLSQANTTAKRSEGGTGIGSGVVSGGTGSGSVSGPGHSHAAPFDWMKKQTFLALPNSGKTRTKDKYRIVYTEIQKVELEKEFLYNQYITIQRKAELAGAIGLSDRQVKIWFQNRRAKDRKQKRKRIEQPNGSSTATPAHNSSLLSSSSASSSSSSSSSSPLSEKLVVKQETLRCDAVKIESKLDSIGRLSVATGKGFDIAPLC